MRYYIKNLNEYKTNDSSELVFGVRNEGIVVLGFEGKPFKNFIQIPDEVNGRKVTEIAPRAFHDFKELDDISFGRYIKSIGERAFYNCTDLRHVDILSASKEFTHIKKETFFNCSYPKFPIFIPMLKIYIKTIN